MAQTIFNVVAKDPKEKHVAEDVRDAAVHEHRRDQREPNRNRRRLETRHLDALAGEGLYGDLTRRGDISAGDYLFWDGGIRVCEFIIRAQPLKKNEHQDVREDDDVVNYRRSPSITIIICNRKKHRWSALLPLPIGRGLG